MLKLILLPIFAIEMEDLNIDIFNLLDNQPQPARGSLIIAKPTVEDFCFKRSVTVLVDHDDENGSMGLIVNRPTGVFLNDVLPELDYHEEIPLYLGGPVGTEMLFFLHSLGTDAIPDSVQVAPDVFYGGDFEALKMYISSGNPVAGKVKFMVGYSGWSKEQLNDELNRHDWAVLKENVAQLVFDTGADNIWENAVALFGEHYRLWRNWPTDVSMN